MILLNIVVFTVKGIDLGFSSWLLYEIPLLMKFFKFVVMFIAVYFFFMKVAKGYKDKVTWVMIMKMMFVIGILLNMGLIANETSKKIEN